MRLKHLFWTALRGCNRLLATGVPGPPHHESAAYIIAGRTTAVYSSLALFIDGPQVDVTMGDRASNAARPLFAAFRICSFQLSFGSTQTPSIRSVDSGFTR